MTDKKSIEVYIRATPLKVVSELLEGDGSKILVSSILTKEAGKSISDAVHETMEYLRSYHLGHIEIKYGHAPIEQIHLERGTPFAVVPAFETIYWGGEYKEKVMGAVADYLTD